MNKQIRIVSLMLSLVFAFALSATAQETTGNIEVTVKDAAGAVVPNAAISAVGAEEKQITSAPGFNGFASLGIGNHSHTIRVANALLEGPESVLTLIAHRL